MKPTPTGFAAREVPSNIAAEMSLLGAVLLEPKTRDIVLLNPDAFRLEKHAWIWAAMQKAETPDVVGVGAVLQERNQLDGIGGYSYLTRLLGAAATSSNAESDAAIIEREHTKRRILDAATEAMELVYNADGFATEELPGVAASKFHGIVNYSQGGLQKIGNASRVVDRLSGIEIEDDAEVVVRSGIDALDRKLVLKNGRAITLSGPPGSGKTSLAMQWVLHAALEQSLRVFVFELEMVRDELLLRMLSQVTQIENEIVEKKTYGEPERARLLDALNRIYKSDIYIDDSPIQTSETIWATSRAKKAKGENPDLIVVDYARLLMDRAASPDLRAGNISRNVKLMAREMDCAVILVQDQNRSQEGLARLKYGGDFDPDQVLFCNKEKGFLEIEKNRHGPTADIPATYRGNVYLWIDLDAPFEMPASPMQTKAAPKVVSAPKPAARPIVSAPPTFNLDAFKTSNDWD